MSHLRVLFVIVVLSSLTSNGQSDEFTYVDAEGKEQTVNARLAGIGQGFLALEQDDGRWRLVSEESVSKRVPGDDPTPLTAEAMAERLAETFTPELLKVRIEDPCVVGVVLTAPLPKESAERMEKFLDKAMSLMQSVDRVFTTFMDDMQLPVAPPEFPLVMLIFETNEDFNEYTNLTTGGRGLSANAISGFYSGLSNWLAIRLDECDSFAVPLHEAIHQQVYNRGVMQRLAPIPKWFGEGIATGFENDGAKINVDPTRINRLYGGNARRKFSVTFADVIQSDDPFHGDVLAGDAYTLAWCLHWLLVTTKPAEYTAFVQQMGTIPPLSPTSQDRRLSDFQSTFGISPGDLENIIGQQLATESRKQRVRLEPRKPAVGKLVTQDQMGVLELGLVRKGNVTQGTGKLKNLSPFRTLTFVVQVRHENWGISWLAEDVAPGRRVDLERRMMPPSASGGYSVQIKSFVPGSVEEQKIRESRLPGSAPAYLSSPVGP
ncbi:MAG: DUF1570 domain-containing protein [Planctomycetaceae bacterium]|nr:DUF1570 domain-containing protein [Planctomycetaceae bacterium]